MYIAYGGLEARELHSSPPYRTSMDLYPLNLLRVQEVMGNSRCFLVLTLLGTIFATLLAQAQGGAGGGSGAGFGGGAGGFQGNIGGQEEESYPPRNIDSGEEANRWTSTSAILTQGDKVEYKFKGVPGQSLFATVRSDNFDPSLKLLDAKGKVVAENDDQYEGNQSPLLMFQFPDDKEYKLIVQNYRSSAGGRFKIYTQTFSAMEIAPGANNKPLKSPDDKPGHGGHLVYFHFKAELGKTYGLRRAHFNTTGRNWDLRYRGIIGPTGVKKTDYLAYVQEGENSPLFEAKAKGDFYLVYDSPSADGTADPRLDVVEVANLEKTGTVKFDLGPTAQKIFKIKVEKSDIVRTTLDAPEDMSFQFKAQTLPDKETEMSKPISFETLQPLMTNDRDSYRVFHDKGEVTLIVSSNSDKPTTVSMANRMDIPTWLDGKSVTGRIELGETQFYLISGIKGDIQRINGRADGFELQFTLMTMDGFLSEFIDQKKHMPSTELQYDETRKYLIMVSSPHGGGSGSYSMNLESAKPEPLAIATVVDYKDGPALGTYSVNVEAGNWYQLTVRGGASGYLLLDDKGDTIGVIHQRFGPQAIYFFQPARKGTIRIKVQGGTKDTRFRLDAAAFPNLGG